MSYRVEAGMTALSEFLQDATNGLNSQIVLARAELGGLTEAQFPSIKSYSLWEWRPEKASTFPHLNLWCSGSSPETEPNSRLYPLSIDITIIAPGKDIGGTAESAILTLWRYFDALQDLMNRRTVFLQGVNLAGGGTVADGRVESAILGPARVGSVKMPTAQKGRGNKALFTSATLMMIEDW